MQVHNALGYFFVLVGGKFRQHLGGSAVLQHLAPAVGDFASLLGIRFENEQGKLADVLLEVKQIQNLLSIREYHLLEIPDPCGAVAYQHRLPVASVTVPDCQGKEMPSEIFRRTYETDIFTPANSAARLPILATPPFDQGVAGEGYAQFVFAPY